MPPPEPPRRGVPLGRVAAEPNVATAPHTPVPPPNDTAVTGRPPAPDHRPPPKEYAHPRTMVRAPSVIDRGPPFSAESEEHTIAGPPPKLDLPQEPEAPPSLVPPAKVDKYERELERKAHKLPSDSALKPLVLKLLAALTGLIVVLTTSAQLLNQYVEWKLKSIEAKQTAQDAVIKPLPAAAASADKSADACRDWAKATDDYHRQIFAKLGVIIPTQPNAPPVTEIKTRAPARKANAVNGAPVLEVLTPPPALP